MSSLRRSLSACFGGNARKTRRQPSFIRRYDASQKQRRHSATTSPNAANPRPVLPQRTPAQRAPKDVIFLTAKQKKLVVETWAKVEDGPALGERIFLHIFFQRPDLLQVFPFAGTPLEELREDPLFRKQAEMFTVFIQHIVEFVEANDAAKIDSLCAWTGERHAKISHLPFDPLWWGIFSDATLACLQPICRAHGPTMAAWEALLEHCVSKMEHAYDIMRHKLRTPQLISEISIDQEAQTPLQTVVSNPL